MTERRDSRSTPEGDRADDTDARWFREAVAPVVDAQPVPDGWREIADRLTPSGTTVVHLEPARTGRSRRGRSLLVAAGVLAVIGLVAAFVLTRGTDDDAQTVVAVPGPDDDATGWYVPVGLPEGWALESVATDWLDVEGPDGSACPCTTTAWTGEDAALVVLSYVDPTRDQPQPGTERTVSLGADVTAWVDELESATVLTWTVDGATSNLTARGLSRDQAIDAARSLVAGTDPDGSPVPGLTRSSSHTIPAGTRAYRSVLVTMVHRASGRRAAYGLVPEGFDGATTFLLIGSPRSTVRLGGQDLPLERIDLDTTDGNEPVETLYVGRWPGAEVFVGRYVEPAASDAMDDGDLQLLAASLRPATVEEWATFLDTATGSVDDVARTDRLADLIVHEGDPGGDSGADPGRDPADDPVTETTVKEEPSTDTTTPDLAMTAAIAHAHRFIELAPQIANGTATLPTDLFATSVDLGLDADVVRRMGAPNLVSADAWVIDEDDGVEDYAGWVPPFSAIELLRRTGDLVVAAGGPEGCVSSRPTAPELDPDRRLVTITPVPGVSCMNWYAVTLVVDQSAGIVGVHLYLTEP